MPHIFCIFLGSHISIHIKFCIFLTLFLGNEMVLLRWVLPVPAHSPVVLAWKRPDLRRHKTSSTTKIMKIHETIWISSRFFTFRVWKIGFLAKFWMCSPHILPILAPSHDSWAKFEVSSSPRARQGTLEGTVVGSSSSCIRRKRKGRYFNSRDKKRPPTTCHLWHIPCAPTTAYWHWMFPIYLP
jgi:hypothetical protein